jgi:hypothetical protein
MPACFLNKDVSSPGEELHAVKKINQFCSMLSPVFDVTYFYGNCGTSYFFITLRCVCGTSRYLSSDFKLCCGFGIRCFFDPGIRDRFLPDPG